MTEADLFMPFRVTGTEGRYNAMIKVEGGGTTGQAGAIRHGIARALLADRPRDQPPAAPPGRPPDAGPAHEGAQEVRAEAGSQGAAVHQAVVPRHRLTPECGRCLLRALAHARPSALAPVLVGAFAFGRHAAA